MFSIITGKPLASDKHPLKEATEKVARVACMPLTDLGKSFLPFNSRWRQNNENPNDAATSQKDDHYLLNQMEQAKPGYLSTSYRTFKTILKTNPAITSGFICMKAVDGLNKVGIPFLISYLGTQLYDQSKTGFSLQKLKPVLIGLGACMLYETAKGAGEYLLTLKFRQSAYRTMEDWFMGQYLNKSLKTLNTPAFHDVIANINSNFSRVRNFAERNSTIVSSFAATGAAFVALAYASPLISAAFVGIAALEIFAGYRSVQRFIKDEAVLGEIRRKYILNRELATKVPNINNLVHLDRTSEIVNEISKADTQLNEKELANVGKYTSDLILTNSLTYIAKGTLVATMLYDLFHGVINNPAMIAGAYLMVDSLSKGINTLAIEVASQARDYIYSAQVNSIKQVGEEFINPYKEYKRIDIDQTPVLEIKDLNYTAKNGLQILKGINLMLRPGKVYAICGESGSGKTTLLKLLMGELELTSGKIFLNNIPKDDVYPADLRKLFSYLPQSYTNVVTQSVIANVNLGSDRPLTAERLARIMQISSFNGLAGKLDQLPTMLLEGGFEACGGESHRIALARCLAQNGRIIILDEPTSDIDPKNER